MSENYQTATFAPIAGTEQKRTRRSNTRSPKLYQVHMEGFDGEYSQHEIEAWSFAEAADKARDLADGPIYNMNIYELPY